MGAMPIRMGYETPCERKIGGLLYGKSPIYLY